MYSFSPPRPISPYRLLCLQRGAEDDATIVVSVVIVVPVVLVDIAEIVAVVVIRRTEPPPTRRRARFSAHNQISFTVDCDTVHDLV